MRRAAPACRARTHAGALVQKPRPGREQRKVGPQSSAGQTRTNVRKNAKTLCKAGAPAPGSAPQASEKAAAKRKPSTRSCLARLVRGRVRRWHASWKRGATFCPLDCFCCCCYALQAGVASVPRQGGAACGAPGGWCPLWSSQAEVGSATLQVGPASEVVGVAAAGAVAQSVLALPGGCQHSERNAKPWGPVPVGDCAPGLKASVHQPRPFLFTRLSATAESTVFLGLNAPARTRTVHRHRRSSRVLGPAASARSNTNSSTGVSVEARDLFFHAFVPVTDAGVVRHQGRRRGATHGNSKQGGSESARHGDSYIV